MPSIGAAPRAAASLSPARAEASRRNGAKSCGPKTFEGKARAAQNALRHGFRAQKHIVLPSEDAAEFAALEAALMEELAPDGALQSVLAQRVVAATWRLARAERLEAQLFAENHLAGRSLGLALIRDCNGARSFDTLLRYRGGALAELWRALRTLKALQAEQAEADRMPAAPPQPRLLPEPRETPIEPDGRGSPGNSGPSRAASEPASPAAARVLVIPCDRVATHRTLPDEPESGGNLGDPEPSRAASEPAPPIEHIGAGTRPPPARRKSAARVGSGEAAFGAVAPAGRPAQRAPTDAL